MRELFKKAFNKVVECPTCGAPLAIENTPTWVIRRCSEDERHYITSKPRSPAEPKSRGGAK